MMNYRTLIRELLSKTGSYKMSEDVLRATIRVATDDIVNEAKFKDALQWQHDRGVIDFTIDQETGVKRWFLT